jgi:hypothetical protein
MTTTAPHSPPAPATDSMSILRSSPKLKESKKDIYRNMHHESSPAPSDHGLDDDDTIDGDGYDDHGDHHLSAHANALLSRMSTADESDDITPRNLSPRRSHSQRSLGGATAAAASTAAAAAAAGAKQMLSMSNEVSAIHPNKSFNNTSVEVQDFLSVDSMSEGGEATAEADHHHHSKNRSSVVQSPELITTSPADIVETFVSEAEEREKEREEIKPRIITKKQATVIGVNRVMEPTIQLSSSLHHTHRDSSSSSSLTSSVPTTTAAPPLAAAADMSSKWVVATKADHADSHPPLSGGSHHAQQSREEDESLYSPRYRDHDHDDSLERSQWSTRGPHGHAPKQQQQQEQSEHDKSASTLHAEQQNEDRSLTPGQYVFPADDSDTEEAEGTHEMSHGSSVRHIDAQRSVKGVCDVLEDVSSPQADNSVLIPSDSIARDDLPLHPPHHLSVGVPSLDLSSSSSRSRNILPPTKELTSAPTSATASASTSLQRISENQKSVLLQTIYPDSGGAIMRNRETRSLPPPAAPPPPDSDMDLMIQRIRILEAESRARREQHQLDEEKYRLSESSWSGEIISLKVYIKDLEEKLQEERARNRKLLSELATRDAEISSLTGPPSLPLSSPLPFGSPVLISCSLC